VLLIAAGMMDHSDYDCFMLSLITHGDEGDVYYGTDGKIFTLDQLMEPIKKCRTLAGKPKICILQVSRVGSFYLDLDWPLCHCSMQGRRQAGSRGCSAPPVIFSSTGTDAGP